MLYMILIIGIVSLVLAILAFVLLKLKPTNGGQGGQKSKTEGRSSTCVCGSNATCDVPTKHSDCPEKFPYFDAEDECCKNWALV